MSKNNEKWTRYLFIQVVKGLEKIHDCGIAHLDIKIENIFVNIPTDGTGGIQLKIGDFGFSGLKPLKPGALHGLYIRAPELIKDPVGPHDGEKLDVFCAA